MKNMVKLFKAMQSIAIIAIVAVIGFGMTGCEETIEGIPSTREVTTAGRLTITGLNDYEYDSVVISLNISSISSLGYNLVGGGTAYNQYMNDDLQGPSTIESIQITGGQITLNVYKQKNEKAPYENYAGNDKNLPLSITVYEAFLAGDLNAMKWTTVNFTNGQASVVFPSDD